MSLSKKLLKIGAYTAGGALVLLGGVAATVYFLSNSKINRRLDIEAKAVAVPHDAETLAQGRHLVNTRGCLDCHGSDLAGAKVIDDPLAGLFHGANITRGNGGLAADYGDVDYVRALRHGVARDGRPLLLMPSHEYTNLSDQDLGAMIAYLKTVPAVDRDTVPIKVGPLMRLLLVLGEVKIATDQIDHAAPREAVVQAEVSPQYGKYLAASCIGCHGDNLSGGKIAGAPPDWPAASNLTRHASSRLTTWTEEQFIQTIRTKVRPDGTTLSPVMPSGFAAMNDTELKALWSYLVTLPATPTGSKS